MKTIKKDFLKLIIVFLSISFCSMIIVSALFWFFIRQNIEFSIKNQFESILQNLNTEFQNVNKFYSDQMALTSYIAYYFEQNNRSIDDNYVVNSRTYLNNIARNLYGITDYVNYFSIIHENGQVLAEFDNMVETPSSELPNINNTLFFKEIINETSFLKKNIVTNRNELYLSKKLHHTHGGFLNGNHFMVSRFALFDTRGINNAILILFKQFNRSLPLFTLNLEKSNICVKLRNKTLINEGTCTLVSSNKYINFDLTNALTGLNFILLISKSSLIFYLIKYTFLIMVLIFVPIYILFQLFIKRFHILSSSFIKIKEQIDLLLGIKEYNSVVTINEDFYYSDFSDISKTFNHFSKELFKYSEIAKAKSKLAAIGQTTAMLAHDVRKPFSIIKILMDRFDSFRNNPSGLKEAKVQVDRSIKHVEGMISDIMDFSREVRLEVNPSSIVNLLDFSIRLSAQGFLSRANNDTDINITYDLKNIYKPLVDDERISRVLSNIITNGIEAIRDIGKKEKGKIEIKTEIKKIDGKGFVEIKISNDGPSIKEDDIPKLFEPFFTKGKKRGTGLGLASCQKIINLHGGNISINNSDNNLGVEFIIDLPASDIKDNVDTKDLPRNIKDILFVEIKKDEAEIEREVDILIKTNKRLKILLLEDEALYRASIRNSIKKNENLDKIITLYEANNIDDALKVAEKEAITHAIVDIDLQDIRNGFDFLNILREEYGDIKSLVHTNRCIEEDRLKAEALKAEGFVPKPLNIEHLVAFLRGERLFKS